MLEVEPIGQRGCVATRSSQNVQSSRPNNVRCKYPIYEIGYIGYYVHGTFFVADWRGRLNQWAHWARTCPGPPDFFDGPLTGCGEINFLKLIILLLMLLHDRTNTSKIDLQ